MTTYRTKPDGFGDMVQVAHNETDPFPGAIEVSAGQPPEDTHGFQGAFVHPDEAPDLARAILVGTGHVVVAAKDVAFAAEVVQGQSFTQTVDDLVDRLRAALGGAA